MKLKPAIAGTCILLLILAAPGWYLYNKPHAGVANVSAEAHVTASKLCNDFELNETLANKNYLNKVLEVTGNVSDIQNENGSQIILLSSDKSMGGVSCRLSNSEKHINMAIKKSAMVTIKGKCSGYLMDVNLVDCILK
jgi:DNA/RNA endonuclease YhcR with UshA esterase domain